MSQPIGILNGVGRNGEHEVGAGDSLQGIAGEFAKHFAHWNIRLPPDDLAQARAGLIRDQGWSIRYIFGSNDRGDYVEYYATHRMTNDRRVRIYTSGEVESLPAIQEGYFFKSEIPGDEERARRAYHEHNEAVAEDLKSLGLYPEGDINAYLRTHTEESLQRALLTFRGEVFGWDDSLMGRSDSCVAGSPRFVQGHLERRYVDSLDCFQHLIEGQAVAPGTVRRLLPTEGPPEPAWDSTAIYWPTTESDRLRAYRALQSRYRDEVLCVSPGLHGVRPGSGLLVGSELPEDAAREGLNFLHSEIATYAWERAEVLKRRGATLGFGRLERSMLSSMPLCFNLFGHLRLHRRIAALVLSEVLGIEIDEVTSIEVEVAPRPKEKYLDDGTAFDAFVEYRRGDDRGFLAIETKYTEPFGTQRPDKRPAYRRYTSSDYGFPDGAFEKLSRSPANQLWRNTMLALAVKENGLDGGPPYDEMYVVVSSCRADSGAERVVDLMQGLVERGRDLVRHVTFEDLTAECLRFSETECWAKEFRRRYLDVSVVLESPLFRGLRLPKELGNQLLGPETPPVVGEVDELFESAGLTPPPIPDSLKSKLRRIDEWAYATRDIDPMKMYMFEYPREVLTSDVGSYVSFCHAGHGVNSYSINFHLIYGPVAVFMQVGWGGVYMDAKKQAETIENWFDHCGELIYRVEQRGSVRENAWPRLVVAQSDFRRINVVGWLDGLVDEKMVEAWLAEHQREDRPALAVAIEELLGEADG